MHVPTGETPFLLTYRTKAIISVDISMSTLRVEWVDRDQNDAQLCPILNQSEDSHHSMPIADSGRAPQESEDS